MTAPSSFARLIFAGFACLIAASTCSAETRPVPGAAGFVGPAGADSCCSAGQPAAPGPDPQLGDVGPASADSATTKSPEAAVALDPDSAARAVDPGPAAASGEPPPAAATQSGLIGFLTSIIQSGVATRP